MSKIPLRGLAIAAAFFLTAAPHRSLLARDLPNGCDMIGTKIEGPEDFVVDKYSTPSAPRLIVSGSTRPKPPEVSGLYQIPIDALSSAPAQRLYVATDDCPPDSDLQASRQTCHLDPLGISLVQGNDGVLRLYVVNHASPPGDASPCAPPTATDGGELDHAAEGTAESIEEYRVEPQCIVFTRRLRDTMLTRANDILALPDGTLYVTNSPSGDLLPKFLDLICRRTSGNVLRYDPGSNKWSTAASGISIANGIAIDGDKRVFVAETATGRILVYEIAEDRSLQLREDPIEVGDMVDNLAWGDDGRLYVTSYSKCSFLLHALKLEASGTTRVFDLTDLTGRRAKPVWSFSGSELSVGSVAFPFAEHMYVGQVFNAGLLRCPFVSEHRVQRADQNRD